MEDSLQQPVEPVEPHTKKNKNKRGNRKNKNKNKNKNKTLTSSSPTPTSPSPSTKSTEYPIPSHPDRGTVLNTPSESPASFSQNHHTRSKGGRKQRSKQEIYSETERLAAENIFENGFQTEEHNEQWGNGNSQEQFGGSMNWAESMSGLGETGYSQQNEDHHQDETHSQTHSQKSRRRRKPRRSSGTGIRSFNVRQAEPGARPIGIKAQGKKNKPTATESSDRNSDSNQQSNNGEGQGTSQPGQKLPKIPGISIKKKQPQQTQGQGQGKDNERDTQQQDQEQSGSSNEGNEFSIKLDLNVELEISFKAKIKGEVMITFLQ